MHYGVDLEERHRIAGGFSCNTLEKDPGDLDTHNRFGQNVPLASVFNLILGHYQKMSFFGKKFDSFPSDCDTRQASMYITDINSKATRHNPKPVRISQISLTQTNVLSTSQVRVLFCRRKSWISNPGLLKYTCGDVVLVFYFSEDTI